jgi:hypothetical protein
MYPLWSFAVTDRDKYYVTFIALHVLKIFNKKRLVRMGVEKTFRIRPLTSSQQL